MQLVLRAVVFEAEELARAKGEATGLSAWLGGAPARATLHVLRAARVGLLVQKPPSPEVEVVWEPCLTISSIRERFLCRYHEGEYEGARYCSAEATEPGGYCRAHAGSPRALYERRAQGDEQACTHASELLEGEEFLVYLLDFGGHRPKVGLTQRWRLLHRVAEQPHTSAAVVARGGLREMRLLERELGRRATEGAGLRVERRLESTARALESAGFSALASRAAWALSTLGLHGDYEAYTVLPKSAAPRVFLAEPAGLHSLAGLAACIRDYWAGRLLAVTERGTLVVPKYELLHRLLGVSRLAPGCAPRGARPLPRL
uniref:DUF2797 domain-containing protein n=1 Tax=Thermofilum pendens TaxID=2269 RepID=A0A7C4B8P5_THEPE